MLGGVQNSGATGTTWNSGDTINGNGLTTVSLIANSTAAVAGNIVDANNIAELNINLVDSSNVNASEFDDVAAIWVRQAVTGQTLNVVDTDLSSAFGISAARAMTYTIDSTATGSADEAVLVAAGAGVKSTERAAFDVTAGNAVEAVALLTSGKNFVGITGGSTTATIEISGDGENNTLISAAAALMTVDASATTGKNTVDVSTLLSTGDTIEGGTGTADTLTAEFAAALPVSATVSGFETLNLKFTAAATYNASKTTGATALTMVPSGSVAAIVSNLSDDVQTVRYGSTTAVSASGQQTIGYATGSNSDVDLIVGATPTSGTAAVSIGTVVFTGNKGGLSVDSVGSTGNTVSALTANSVTSLSVAGGTQALTLGAISATAAASVTVDGSTKNTRTGKITLDESTSEIDISSGAGTAIVSSDAAVTGDGIALASSAADKNVATTINITSDAKAVTVGTTVISAASVASDLAATVNVEGGVGAINSGVMTFTGGSAATDTYSVNVNATATDGTVTLSGITLDEATSAASANVANINLAAAGGDITLSALLLTDITKTNLTVQAASGDTATITQINGASTSSTAGNLSSITATGAGTIVIGNASPTTATSVDGDTVVDATSTTGNFSLLLGNTNGTNTVTVYLGDAATDKTNTVVTGAGADTVFGGSGNDTITTGAGADYIEGRAGNDSLSGGDDIDTIDGGSGNDTITGGAAADIIFLGTGVDTVVYTSTGATLTGQFGDLIDGFGSTDLFQFASGALYNGAGTSATATADLSLQDITGTTGTVATTAEIVQYTGGDLDALTVTAAAAALVGVSLASTTAAVNSDIIFVLSDGTDIGLFLFIGTTTNVTIDAAELQLINTLDAYSTPLAINNFIIG